MKVTTRRVLAHDDQCEAEPGRPRAVCSCAVREIGWVAREARELSESMPEPGTPDRSAWDARWEAFCTRKRVLQAYAEARRAR
jgi:hypothetical protein